MILLQTQVNSMEYNYLGERDGAEHNICESLTPIKMSLSKNTSFQTLHMICLLLEKKKKKEVAFFLIPPVFIGYRRMRITYRRN